MGSSTFDIHDFMSECTVEILLGKPDVLEPCAIDYNCFI